METGTGSEGERGAVSNVNVYASVSERDDASADGGPRHLVGLNVSFLLGGET